MDNILVLSTGLSKQKLIDFINSKKDFCAAMINPRLGTNFQQANVYIERRKNLLFLLVNRAGFGLPNAQYVTWSGLYTEMLPIFESQPFSIAHMALARFVAKSPKSKSFTLLRMALDEIHYRAAHLVLGDKERFVTVVKPNNRVAKKTKKQIAEGQLTLF